MKRLNILCLFAILFFVACGSSYSDKSSSEDEKTEESSSEGKSEKTGIALIDQLSELGTKMEEAAKDLEEGKTVKAVNFRELKKLLPEEAAGIPRENASGETTSMMGFSISKAEGKYRHEDRQNKAQIDIEIADAAATQIVLVGLAAWSMIDVDKEDDYGYERTMKYKGGKAYQKFDSKRKRGEFSTLVGERYLVSVKGRNVEMDDIINIMDDINFKKLANLKPEEE